MNGCAINVKVSRPKTTHLNKHWFIILSMDGKGIRKLGLARKARKQKKHEVWDPKKKKHVKKAER